MLVRADAELGEVAAQGRVRVERRRGTRGPTRRRARRRGPRCAAARRRRARSAPPERATIVPSPPAGAMKPSPHGRFPKMPRAVRSPSSGMPSRPRRSSRRSVPRGQVTCASSASVRSCATAAQRRVIVVEVGRHQAGEHVLGDARQRRAAGAVLAGGLARDRVAQRRLARREEDVARGERGGDRARRLEAAARVRRQDDQRAVGAAGAPGVEHRMAERLAVGVGDDEQLLAVAQGEAAAEDGVEGAIEVWGHAVAGYRWLRRLAVPAARLRAHEVALPARSGARPRRRRSRDRAGPGS